MFGARRTSSAGGVRSGGVGGGTTGAALGRRGSRATSLGARGQLRNVMAKVLESNNYYGGMKLNQLSGRNVASSTVNARFGAPGSIPSSNKAPPTAPAIVSGGSRATSSSVFSGLALRRRFGSRQRSATSVVVTVTFVAIFTCIVAMEVLFIDEDKRLKLWSKVPEMQDGAGSAGGDGNAVEQRARQPMPPVLQLPIEVQNLLINSNAGLIGGDAGPRRHFYGTVDEESKLNDVVPEKIGSRTNDDDPGRGAGSVAGGGRALHQEDKVGAAASYTTAHRTHAPAGHDDAVAPGSSDADAVNGTKSASGHIARQQQQQQQHSWLPANHTFASGDWQPVLGAKDKFYVYSAYLDVRQGRFVRVIGAARTRNYEKVICVYWYGADPLVTPPITVQASTKVIRENWNLKYSAMFVLCPLFLYNLGRTVPVPDEVSVVVGSDFSSLGNRLEVRNRNVSGTDEEKSIGFAVCVKPLHYNFNRAAQLVEFIELNRILGVRHFVFYNHTIGREVDCLLRRYEAEGLVTLLPWQLDMLSQKEIRTEGLFAAINDCLYRHMYRYRYLLMIDIDEYIVPHRNGTLVAMLREFNRKVDPSKAGSFSFMNSFFYLQWPNDPNSRDLVAPLVTLRKTKRRAKFHPHKQRSKCIVMPRFVVEMGNHFVWEFLPGKGAVNVAPEIAFLHHYRVCEFGGNDCVKTQSLTDRTVYRYKTELVQRFQQRIERTLNASAASGADPRCRNLSFNLTSVATV